MVATVIPEAGGGRSRSPGGRVGAIRRRRLRLLVGWLMLSPALGLVITFFVLPLITLVVMSFFNWPLIGSIRPVGLANYEAVLSDGNFGESLKFTLTFTVVLVPITLLVGYAAAVMVRSNVRGTGFFRTSFFLPVPVGLTAAAYMFSVLLAPGTGVFNVLLKAVGVTDGETAWFSATTPAFWAVIMITVWKGIGVPMILFMAGMQSIPDELYEAAKIDGAGWLRRELSITLPLIRNVMALCLVLSVSGTLLTFDQFFVLTKGGPSNSTITAVFYNYVVSFVRYRLGYGAAVSVVLMLIILVVTLFQLRTFRTNAKAGA